VLKVGFIGFGEAAAVLAKPLIESGVKINVYDVLLTQSKGKELLEKRAVGMNVNFLDLSEATKNSKYIISTVTTQVAKQVASDCGN